MDNEIKSQLCREHHLVIGGGVAGTLTALVMRRAGYKVTLLESSFGMHSTYAVGADTSAVVSENHSGAEYPFDETSAKDCLEARLDNELIFPEWIYAGKGHTRILASIVAGGGDDDIVSRCRNNVRILREHYDALVQSGLRARLFGDSNQAFREIDANMGVNDVGAAFITPQRGLNPVFVAAALEFALRTSGVVVKAGVTAKETLRLSDGRFRVSTSSAVGSRRPEVYEVDQLTIAAACHGLVMARQLNPMLELPRLFAAIRQIELVDLPESTEHTYTCLKLEDRHGGMFSPLNKGLALIYHPPAAHVETLRLWELDYRLPERWRDLAGSSAVVAERAKRTCEILRDFYPELRNSKRVKSFLKIAINTVADSRVRRNLRPINICEGAVLILLAKWSMCATNAFATLTLSVKTSLSRRGVAANDAEELATAYVMSVKRDFNVPAPDIGKADMWEVLHRHCANMAFPNDMAIPMT
jgi:glycine/D-amino acid oxidase-like deaminating enzyme